MSIMCSAEQAGQFLYHQMHIFHTLTMFGACGNDIDSCGIDAAVAKNIGKLGNILLDAVEHPCKQVTEIVREHIIRIDICILTQIFHIPPYICPA